MNSVTYSQSLELTDALRKSINSNFDETINQRFPKMRYQLFTRIITVRARTLYRRPRYMIELILRLPRIRSPLVLKKTGKDLYQLIAKTSSVLDRLVKQKIQKRGKNHGNK